MRKVVKRAGEKIFDQSPALELLVDRDGAAAGARGIARQENRRWLRVLEQGARPQHEHRRRLSHGHYSASTIGRALSAARYARAAGAHATARAVAGAGGAGLRPLKDLNNPLLDPFFVTGYRIGVAFALEQKLIRGPVDVDAWIDRSYLDGALRSLGLAGFWPSRRALAEKGA